MFDRITELAESLIKGMTEHTNTGSYIDCRAFKTFWVDMDKQYLAIMVSDHRSAGYYGGFEYINEEYEMTCGDYVFYSNDDEHVRRIIDQFDDTGEHDEEDDEWGDE